MVNFTLFLQKFLNRKLSFGQKRVHFSKSCLFHFWFTVQLRRGAFFSLLVPLGQQFLYKKQFLVY